MAAPSAEELREWLVGGELLKLTDASEAVLEACPLVVSSVATFQSFHGERAGKAFEAMLVAQLAARHPPHIHAPRKDKAKGRTPDGASSTKSAASFDPDSLERQAHRIEAAALLPMGERNHYEVMGLGDLGPEATDEDIRKAYRKLVLIYHPDKRADASSDGRQTNAVFLAIKKAHEILSDVSKRKEYDSRFGFDDSIPSGTEDLSEEGAFFELYRPVFRRNARFCAETPVPDLGDADSDYADVDAFYRFWFSFKSWREFTDQDEHDPDMAQSRDERRWMMQQNEKVRAKLKTQENERISKLVSRAHANDPRVKAARDAEREERIRRREERQAKKDAEELARKEAEQRAADLRRRQEEEAKRQEEERREELREAKRALRALALPLIEGGEAVRVEAEETIKVVVEGGDGSGEIREVRVSDDVVVSEADLRLLSNRLSTEELRELSGVMGMALAGLPPGAPLDPKTECGRAALTVLARRTWLEKERVRVEGEILDARHGVNSIASGKKTGAGAPWSAEELSGLARGMKKFPGGVKGRWDAVALYLNGLAVGPKRTSKECISKAEAIRSGAAGTPATPASETPTPLPEDAGDWTTEQQSALEAALRKYPSTPDVPVKERWKLVASEVPGKSMKECVARFKALRESLKKSGASTPSVSEGSPSPAVSAAGEGPKARKAVRGIKKSK
jgi:DnaJ homolog subfamily C member 2